ncbi:putative ATP-dependent helicase/nuclease subunit A [Lactobacillus iners LactinV 11V1-d]|nr:putative ATP-dependent helicase/nuclease subunit A [Lactobacillus iners LactinV 11V1-d]
MTSFTKEQEKAIYDSNIDILVSASAGSGKTTVLVERVIKKYYTINL